MIKPDRKWEITDYREEGMDLIPIWSSHPRSHNTQCKCGIWVKDEDLDDHIMKRIKHVTT